MNIVFDLGAVVIGWEPALLLQTHFPERAPDMDAARAQGWQAIHCTSPATLSTHVLRHLELSRIPHRSTM